jgi:hypothetical protein
VPTRFPATFHLENTERWGKRELNCQQISPRTAALRSISLLRLPPRDLNASKPTMFDALKPFLFTFLLISGGIVSIAFSSWQFQVKGDSDLQFIYLQSGEKVDFDYVCNHFPFNWMRPFRVTADGLSSSLCGFSEANTGFRLALACVTVLAGVWLVFHKNVENAKLYTYWGLFAVMVFWLAASVADIIAVLQGGKSCQQGLAEYSDGFLNCDTAEYGITIAIDILMCLIMFACWLLAGRDVEPTAGTVAETGGAKYSATRL